MLGSAALCARLESGRLKGYSSPIDAFASCEIKRKGDPVIVLQNTRPPTQTGIRDNKSGDSINRKLLAGPDDFIGADRFASGIVAENDDALTRNLNGCQNDRVDQTDTLAS